MAILHGFLPPLFVRDQEGLIHKAALANDRIGHLQGNAEAVMLVDQSECDLCRLCWPPLPVVDANADRSEAAG